MFKKAVSISSRGLMHTESTSSQLANQSGESLKSEVVALYKNLLFLSREWHHDLKPQIKNAFLKNKDVSDPDEIRNLIARGEYVSREIIATYHLKKYRTMKRRYYANEETTKKLESIYKEFTS